MATIVRPEVATYEQYIDGEWVGAENGETYDVINPSTEEVMARAPAGTRADARRAIGAARRAFDGGEWRFKTQQQRSEIMFEIVRHLQTVSDDWGLLEAQNAGAVIRKTAVVDVPLAIEHFRSLAEQALSIPWYEPLAWFDQPYVSWNFVQREAVGVCAGIIPWNYPLIFAVWKIAPAIAMGNSIVLKPSTHTPLTALALVRAIDETGLIPKGVINVVTGPADTVGAELVESGDVDKLAFTGSTATGRTILAAAAANIKKVTLELGGKSANIVCPDADLDIAVDGTLFGTFFHQGQMCESGTRLFVHDDIYDTFVDRLVDSAASLRVGDATDFDSQVGPVITKQQYEMILAAIQRAQQEGATLACGGGRPKSVGERGYFVQPTVLVDVNPDSHAATEEIFGPVLAVQRWSDQGEVIERANRTVYGLAGGVWSRDTRSAIEMAKLLRTGTVWINDWHLLNPQAPFGGYKQSGIGRELGTYGLKEYTEVKHIHVDQGVPRRERYFWDVLLG
ncbi:MAG: aldehyde dehydrogenase family protein [Chloroflexi bacterium]|nr:MAG: aldehyde dehydrogenase family protein [Chloroflexota bacterium]TMF14197.1 MAG: aldehyde dehydrogenase family protein [Chloroflexota bacterium]